ncbi:hypothetical protein JXA32_03905 [Candidatus Sumerlaeota bacterium]|nr:hypothetical protein [Candidatus Sumerlaeota bacterium]
MTHFGNIRSIATWISIALILILFWSMGFYLMRLTERVKEQALDKELADAGRELTKQIQSDDASLVLEYGDPQSSVYPWETLAMLPETLAYGRLQTILSGAVLEYGLSGLAVIDGDGAVICDTRGEQLIGEAFRYEERDKTLIAEALNGFPQASPRKEFPRSLPKRFYTPLRNSKNRAVALLCVERRRGYLEEIRELKTRMFALMLVGAGLLLLVGLGQQQALKRLDLMERAMEQNDRLQSLGVMAAGLAHELRNPLQIMRVTAEELRYEVKGDAALEDMSSDMIVEIDRMNRLIQQLLQFSRPEDSDVRGPEVCDVPGLIESMMNMVRKNMKRQSTALVFDPPAEELPRAAIHPDALRQALLNVVLNAGDAVGENGRIEISLQRGKHHALRLEVHDNGCGIDPKRLGRIFDPFYSGKPGGTGLGLSITRRILERYGGSIELESKPGQGAKAIITLLTVKEMETDENAKTQSREESKGR